MTENQVNIRWLGRQPYLDSWRAMQCFTQERNEATIDEIWLLEHDPVFTQGQNGKPEHILNPGEIPIVQTDRGGQITYHGPGQLMVYTLLDLRRLHITIRGLVTALEQSIIDFLAAFNISAHAKCAAPGVYYDEKKICSIGLRVRRGCAYHGIAFNVNMDLQPFSRINPCGFKALQMTQLSSCGGMEEVKQTGLALVPYLTKNLVYTRAEFCNHSDFVHETLSAGTFKRLF